MELEAMMQNLSNIQKAKQRKEEQNHQAHNKVIQSQFPWAIHNNTIPNHFIHSQSVMASIQNGTANLPHMVFLHQHRAKSPGSQQSNSESIPLGNS